VNIRIGIQQSMKEIELEMPASLSDADLRAQVTAALKDDDVLWLTDKKGRTLGVPAARISYVEMAATNERVVGFGS